MIIYDAVCRAAENTNVILTLNAFILTLNASHIDTQNCCTMDRSFSIAILCHLAFYKGDEASISLINPNNGGILNGA